jgi:Ca-activated chloride channel family protein
MIRGCVSRIQDTNLFEASSHGRIPKRELANGGIFASHYFDINPDRETFTDPVVLKTFSSKFVHPVTERREQLLVLGLTGSEDGKNRRRKTDFVMVIDRSGSMREPLSDPGSGYGSGGQSPVGDRSKMSLTIDATKRIFDLIEDDEQVAICTFETTAEVVEDLKPKGAIDRKSFFDQLDTITANGGTNVQAALHVAISLLKASATHGRNQRILFLTDACPTEGAGSGVIRNYAEQAFVESSGLIGVTYVGIGLSFDEATCAELTAAHGTSVYSASNTTELEEFVNCQFNYLVSPVAFDVKVALSSRDYTIGEAFGGDTDYKKDGSLIEFRTMTASSISRDGVKGSALILHLNPVSESGSPPVGASVRLVVEWTLFDGKKGTQTMDVVLKEEPVAVTEKAFALSVYYRTLHQVLPNDPIWKATFTAAERDLLTKLLAFLNSQSPPLLACFQAETKVVSDLIALE